MREILKFWDGRVPVVSRCRIWSLLRCRDRSHQEPRHPGQWIELRWEVSHKTDSQVLAFRGVALSWGHDSHWLGRGNEYADVSASAGKWLLKGWKRLCLTKGMLPPLLPRMEEWWEWEDNSQSAFSPESLSRETCQRPESNLASCSRRWSLASSSW